MNENIDLTKILKDCPKGWKFYSSIYGEVEFKSIEFERLKPIYNPLIGLSSLFEEDPYPIKYIAQDVRHSVSKVGEHIKGKGECTFFPSKDQRDWSKFSAPWYKKGKFDPKTLQAFDKVLARIDGGDVYCWFADFVSTPTIEKYDLLPCIMSNKDANMIIPYNDDTKHLVGTNEEAPEYYRYWEDEPVEVFLNMEE